ncbi:MAG: glycerate kinase, partial [Lachnospiraceae bacterium]|nr:glycerate kinase [Lachnospiraceae bacterium]
MKILIAIDSFKGCLTSYEAGYAVKEAIKELNNDAEVEVFSVSDGGEGLTEALLANKEYELRTLNVTGPLGNIIEASYGIYQRDGKKTAVVEMAAAAGLTLVHKEKRNPLYTTTYGVGEMILDA